MNLAGLYAHQMGIKYIDIYIFKKNSIYTCSLFLIDTGTVEFVREDNSIFQFPEQVKVPLEYIV